MLVSTSFDDWLNEEKIRTPLYYAQLNNGEIVIQDDGHPDRPGPAWLRLKEYLRVMGFQIDKLWVGFRNETKHLLPEKAEGYLFVKSLAGIWGLDVSLHFYVFGYLKGDVVHCKKIKVPELVSFDEYIKPSSDYLEVLIRNG